MTTDTTTPADDECPQCRNLYRERAHLLAFLAAMNPAVLSYIDPHQPERPVLIIDSTVGQLTWHIDPRDLGLFAADVPVVSPDDHRAQWDGHDTELKYNRLRVLVVLAQRRPPVTGRSTGGLRSPDDSHLMATPAHHQRYM